MIKIIENLPSNVVGFEASGEVRASDYESVLDPAIKSALAKNDKIRVLYVLGDDFDGYSGGAMWQDAKLGISDWKRWEKVAFVSDHKGYRDGVKVFGWAVPGEIRVFSVDELSEAKSWVAE